MKQIRLMSLAIDHFKGCTHLDLDLQGRSATIYGDNAAGKTTIYDALTWLLFGKDSQGKSDFDIKPLDPDGAVLDHAAVTGVEASFSTGEGAVRLRKEYYEKWSTKRGSVDKTYDGNTCDYYADGVPCKKYEFEERVSGLVEESVFRLLAGTSYFCGSLSWQDRRTVLFQVCGTATDEEIMGRDIRFAPLASALNGMAMGDFRKKLQAERRGYSTSREAVPIRLDECRKTVEELQGIDFDALRAEVSQRIQKRDELSAELLKLKHNELLDAKRNQRDSVQNLLSKLENENTAYRQAQILPIIDEETPIRLELEGEKKALVRALGDKSREDQLIAAEEVAIESCRSRWSAIHEETFQAQTCPTCGRSLTGKPLEDAAAQFSARKADRLEGVVRESDVHKESLSVAKESREAAVERAVEAENRVAELMDKLAAIKPTERPEIADKPGYAEERSALEKRIGSLELEIGKLTGESAAIREEIDGKIKALSEEIDAINGTVAKEAVLTAALRRMDDLRADAREAAAKMESLDRYLALCDDFIRYKTRFIEESVNSKFEMVRFRLFEEQVNGGVSECCDPTVNGVPYTSLNNGARINAGLDVIATLSEHYGVNVPLFIDNAESVTALLPVEAQVIRLVVSESDKKLRCEYEGKR